MHPQFQPLTVQWFKRAFIYTGSIGDFRYRFATDTDSQTGEKVIHASVYTALCFEKARDVQTQTFPWDEGGVEALKVWVDSKYRDFSQKGTL
jgi:hypothetical protein